MIDFLITIFCFLFVVGLWIYLFLDARSYRRAREKESADYKLELRISSIERKINRLESKSGCYYE
jgi:cbb3-type cytochrome oxidase subunit 3